MSLILNEDRDLAKMLPINPVAIRQQALKDAADYLRERAERLRKQQAKSYSGSRAATINALRMWAHEVRRL